MWTWVSNTDLSLASPECYRHTTRDVLSQQVEKSYFYRRVHIKGAERYYWEGGWRGGWWRGACCDNMGFAALTEVCTLGVPSSYY